MNASDLISVLEELSKQPETPLVINGPHSSRLVINKIESKEDGVHIDLGFYTLPNKSDPIGWQPDFTGV